MDLRDTDNMHPNIILVYSNATKNRKYYISFENYVINVSSRSQISKDQQELECRIYFLFRNFSIFIFFSILKVPFENFIEVIDFYFKIHKVFGLDYNKALLQAMICIEKYIFKFTKISQQLSAKTMTTATAFFKEW